MTKAFTQGPWVAVEVGQGGPHENPMPIYEIHTADGRVVIAEYVDARNAAILTTAPELLEALRELLHAELTPMPAAEAGTDAQNDWADRRAAARNNASALIAKATGTAS